MIFLLLLFIFAYFLRRSLSSFLTNLTLDCTEIIEIWQAENRKAREERREFYIERHKSISEIANKDKY